MEFFTKMVKLLKGDIDIIKCPYGNIIFDSLQEGTICRLPV